VDPALRLNIVLGYAQDLTGDRPVDVPALTIEGNEAGLRCLIERLTHAMEGPRGCGYHTHITCRDDPGINLEPTELFITLRCID